MLQTRTCYFDDVRHEFNYGVNSTSKLEYKFESGALNESYADFFGVLIDGDDDWLIGEVFSTAVILLEV